MIGRVTALEVDADVTDAVLDYLNRAHRHPSHATFLAATFDRRSDEDGILAIWAVLEKSTAAAPTEGRNDRRVRVKRSKADALFLHRLASIVDERAGIIAELTGLRLAVLTFGADAFIANPVPATKAGAFRIPIEAPRPRAQMTTWPELVTIELAEIEVEERARQIIERRYFRDRSLLYEETANDWLRLRWQADRIEEELALRARGPTKPGRNSHPRRTTPREPDGLDPQVSERVQDLEDLARVDGLCYLGEDARARAIVNRHLRRNAGESSSFS